MTSDRQRAMAHLAEAIEAHEELKAAHAFQPRDYDLIGRLKAAERFNLGAAQVYAALAVAEAARPRPSIISLPPLAGSGL